MSLQRNKTRFFQNIKLVEEEPAQMTPVDRFLFVWELTKEINSLTGDFNVESRLQRNVVHFIRKRQINRS